MLESLRFVEFLLLFGFCLQDIKTQQSGYGR